ncbi:Hypothetical protein CINCED_3A011422, partial [Cinara cedri]
PCRAVRRAIIRSAAVVQSSRSEPDRSSRNTTTSQNIFRNIVKDLLSKSGYDEG